MATRESEKQLMKELEHAVTDLDATVRTAAKAKEAYDAENAKLAKAKTEAESIARAIDALRKGDNPAHRERIIEEARANVRRGGPVA